MLAQGAGSVGVAPASPGFPQEYPVAHTIQNGLEVILRPLKNPLYDTELLNTGGAAQQVQFFQRGLGQATAVGALVKTLAETNLTQSGSLPSPMHFQIFGFIFELQSNVSLLNFNAIYAASTFTFNFSGNRVYLQLPLYRIPAGVGITGFASTTVGATQLGGVQNGLGHVGNLYGFTINRQALQIRPNEAFNAIIAWPTAAPVLNAVDFSGAAITPTAAFVRMRTYIVGILYQSL